MAKWLAQYRCLSCQAVWQQLAGPTDCPNCGDLYVEWTNYEQLANSKGAVTATPSEAPQHADCITA
jgi:rubredoxin